MAPFSANLELTKTHSARACAIWDTLKEKTLSLSGDLESETASAQRALAAELVRLKVDVIVAVGSGDIRAAKEATATIPIVMIKPGDPVESGFVASLARPGGNITGFGNPSPGAQRKTTRASERDGSQALARGRFP